MNRAYRIVWSAARQAWIVASEKAGSGGEEGGGSAPAAGRGRRGSGGDV
ncbi:ESPR-type extended signal peptide-containing protein [Pantoea ananatis]|nr:ESPR-type extended signal peptide-containing protein [Pantoea ananatis]